MSARTATLPERHECFVGLSFVAEHGLPGYPAPVMEATPLRPSQASGRLDHRARNPLWLGIPDGSLPVGT